MKKERVEVYCELNSHTKDHPRHRELVFMYGGSSMKLTQRLVVWHRGGMGYIDHMETTMGFDPEWADDLKVVLDYIKWFTTKSRPHWEKYATDHRCTWTLPDVEVDLHFYCSPKSFSEVEGKKKEIERAVLLAIRDILETPEEIAMNAVSTSNR
jgi:hypothetical protein